MMANKKRLIDAIEYCWKLVAERDYPGRSQEFMDTIEVAIADIGAMPTVDAVEVVRCKDRFANGCCSVQIDLDMGDEGYCPKGRRRTDG